MGEGEQQFDRRGKLYPMINGQLSPMLATHGHIDGVRLFPLSTLSQRFTELDPNYRYYIHCKSGVRSMKALKFLREQGFKYLKSVKGGITAWADEIDHNVPKY